MAPKRKILALERLLEMREQARAQGRTLVHCHGCFDIVHPGHIHHLEYARSLGDLLVVTVSADSQVNKGIDRPLIPDDLRAMSLAALECVDWVFVNPHPTAVELLTQLQPDVYVKGREYETSSDPRFLAEREVVTGNGGRVVFSSGDIVFSSTALIRSLESSDVFNEEKLYRLRERYGLSVSNLHQTVAKFRGQKVVVIGDSITDRYHFCDATGIAGEAPMMSLRLLQSCEYDGGAGVIALHLAGLDARPVLLTCLADDESSRQVEMRLAAAGVEVDAVRSRKSVVTKHRYLVDQSKVMKLDEGSVSPLDSTHEEILAEKILAAAHGAAAVIFADFGYGTITAGLLQRVMKPLRKMVNVITADVSGRQSSLLYFKGVDLLCPTEREMRETLHDFSSGLGAVVAQLLSQTKAKQAIITLGKQGLVTFDVPPDALSTEKRVRLRSEYVPAIATHAVDPLGCGDALLATASLTLASGGNLHAAAYLGAIAAAFEVQQVGNKPITTAQLLARVNQPDYVQAATRLAV